MKTVVVLEQGKHNWGAYAPDIEDSIIATGATREETITNFRAALRSLSDFKHTVPDSMELEIRETAAA